MTANPMHRAPPPAGDDLELTVLEVSPERDPGGTRLRATLEAHLELERTHVLRMILLYQTIFFALPLWLSVASPALLPTGLRNLTLLAWAGCAAGCVLSLVSELRWQRALVRIAAEPPSRATSRLLVRR